MCVCVCVCVCACVHVLGVFERVVACGSAGASECVSIRPVRASI